MISPRAIIVAIKGDNIMKSLKIIMASSLFILVSFPVYSDGKVPYPDGYRSWTHVKSMIIQAGHPLAETDQGIHHIYANENAIKGLKTGDYPDSATLVYDLLEYIEKEKFLG